MLNSFPVSLIAGAVLGFLAGLGVGGGSLLILWLTAIVAIPYPQARIMNLLFFLPCALTASAFHIRKRAVDIKKILPAILAGSIAAVAFYFVSRAIDTNWLQRGFGLLLLITGVRELLYKPRNHSR